MRPKLLMRFHRCGHSYCSTQGSTLLELLVALALFAVVSGVGFTLMHQQQNVSQSLQGQVGLNMALRNTESLLQMDLANAGNGYFQIQNSANGALGVSINNNVVATGSTCTTTVAASGMAPTKTYGTNCFDQLYVFSFVDPTLSYPTPALQFNAPADVSSVSSITGTVPSAYLANNTFTQAVAAFNVGDYLLLATNSGTTDFTGTNTVVFPAYTVVRISSISSSTPNITFGLSFKTNSNGSNSLTNDPLNITACDGAATCPPSTVTGTPPLPTGDPMDNYLKSSFTTSDYILKIVPIGYQVCNGPGSPTTSTGALYSCDQTSTSPDIANPKLWRTIKSNATQGTAASPVNCTATTPGGCCPQNYVCSEVMEQILGFKVGASIWNEPNPDITVPADVPFYNYDASSYSIWPLLADRAFNFSNVHAVRVSIIARTTPATTANYVYRNQFDNGPYQVQGMALVVNPRNLNQQTY